MRSPSVRAVFDIGLAIVAVFLDIGLAIIALIQRKNLIKREEFRFNGRIEFKKSLVKKKELHQHKKCLKDMKKEELNPNRRV